MDDQLALCLGAIGPEYSVALGPGVNPDAASENGAIVFGSLALEQEDAAGNSLNSSIAWTPLVRSLVCWTSYLVELEKISVGGVDIGTYANATSSQMASAYALGCGAVVLDSGSTFMYMDTLPLAALTAAIAAGLRGGAEEAPCPAVLLDTPGSNGTVVTCYATKAYEMHQLPSYFPDVVLDLSAAQLVLGPANYLFQLGPYWPGLYVLGVYDSFGRGTVLGAIALSNNLVVFDRTNMKVGFRNATDCDMFGRSGVLVAPPTAGRTGLGGDALKVLMAPGALQAIILLTCFVWAISACFCC